MAPMSSWPCWLSSPPTDRSSPSPCSTPSAATTSIPRPLPPGACDGAVTGARMHPRGIGLRCTTMATPTFPVTGDEAADSLLVTDPLALLIGMLLDQQVPMEWAFRAPSTLKGRLGGLDAGAIAAMTPEARRAAG